MKTTWSVNTEKTLQENVDVVIKQLWDFNMEYYIKKTKTRIVWDVNAKQNL